MTSQNEQQVITIHRLSNISRSKGNQAMKFGQLIEHSMKNIFLGKSYTKFDGGASPRPFYKKSKLNIRSTVRNVIILLLLYVLVEIYENILKRSWWPPVFTLYKAFLKNKKRSGTSLSVSICAWFLKKNISHDVFHYLPDFIIWLPFISWDVGQHV